LIAQLDTVARASTGRIIAALAARFRDLDLAEEAFADACEAAARHWPTRGLPDDPAAWLYQVAARRALDAVRRGEVRARLLPDVADHGPHRPDEEVEDIHLIPDERLRLIFVCCHPAIAPESRAALTLRLVCGLSAAAIAASFLIGEATLLQRLTRAKRKIAQAGIPFEVPGPAEWPERLDAILSTLEIAYAKAHADAAGNAPHAGFAAEIMALTDTLATMLPDQGEVLGLAALVRYAEARRPARTDADGMMIPLAEQDPRLWDRRLIDAGNLYLHRARNVDVTGSRALQAALHGVWCARQSLADPPPWPTILTLYDALLRQRDDVVVRLNRAVALAEVAGPAAALTELDRLACPRLDAFQPWHAVRADLLRRVGRVAESSAAYARAIALAEGEAEAKWLRARQQQLAP
jgi:RNA polymerase sigma-70 factor (ECF subfamily)